MRFVGWPTKFNTEDGLVPIDVQDIDLYASANEIRTLASFLMGAADQLEHAELKNEELNVGIDFGDSKSDAQTGIWINIVRHAV
jgi:hypothetical protein